MSFVPLSANAQYAIGGVTQLPNRRKHYDELTINKRKSRRDQRVTRKIETLTTSEGMYKKMLRKSRRGKKGTPPYARQIRTMLDHFYDQSIIATEKGHFPSLPKASVVDQAPPNKGFTEVKRSKRSQVPGSEIDFKLKNAFVPTNYQRFTDLSLCTPALRIAGTEQPGSGVTGGPEINIVHPFVPNPSYGGTQIRYR